MRRSSMRKSPASPGGDNFYFHTRLEQLPAAPRGDIGDNGADGQLEAEVFAVRAVPSPGLAVAAVPGPELLLVAVAEEQARVGAADGENVAPLAAIAAARPREAFPLDVPPPHDAV